MTIAGTQLPASGAEPPWWSGDDGVGAVSAASVKASLDCSTKAAGKFNTVLRAVQKGARGNGITIQLIGDSAAGAGVLFSSTPDANGDGGGTVVIHYESGVSTVGAIETAIAAAVKVGVGGVNIVEIQTHGTLATVLTAPADNFAASHLAGGLSAEGHMLAGRHQDSAIVYVAVSNWDAITSLEMLVERNTMPDGSGRWGRLEEYALAAEAVGFDIDISSGAFKIKNTAPVNQNIAIRIVVPGAQRIRVGFRAGSAGAVAAFACTAALELIQDRITA